MMFKILVVQAANNLSDERTELLINDRPSFMRFLGLSLSDRVPDARTLWLVREKLTKAGVISRLFERFDARLREAGFIAMAGRIVDASPIAAPRQRNTEDEKKAIKESRIPDDWKKKPAKPRQKDRDAWWTLKFTKAKPKEDDAPPIDLAIPVFGYQNHVSYIPYMRLLLSGGSGEAFAGDSRMTNGEQKPHVRDVSTRDPMAALLRSGQVKAFADKDSACAASESTTRTKDRSDFFS